MTDQTKKHKHLTLNDRIEIQGCLDKGMTFKDIASRIDKDPTTVSKEVKKHIHQHSTQTTDETLGICPLLRKSPFVCNACRKRHFASCHYPKQLYLAREADQDYRSLLSEAREGVALNKDDFLTTEQIVSDGIKKGQHINHIIASHDLPYSRASIYRHIHRHFYDVGLIDLPRAVKFKPRKSKSGLVSIPYSMKKGRTYEDYEAFMEENPVLELTELDTVIGRIGGKAIMTLQFVNTHFMIGLLLEAKTAAEAGAKITALKQRLHDAGIAFGALCPVLLTDNGGEFAHAPAFELDFDGNQESHLFYCHPYRSCEKPNIEKNHTIFRDICPKGTSFDSFSQDDVNLIFSHVNAIKRESINGKSPYEFFSFLFGENTASVLGISHIPAEDVIQSPLLLKKRK